MIEQFNPGDYVTYFFKEKKERGIVKTVRDDGTVFVVYKCNDDWENYRNYTGVNTDPVYLKKGWLI